MVIAAVLCFAASSRVRGEQRIEYLKEEPPTGSVPHRKIVYVDDGACPKGEVKEITGGSQAKSIPRKVRCVKRPN